MLQDQEAQAAEVIDNWFNVLNMIVNFTCALFICYIFPEILFDVSFFYLDGAHFHCYQAWRSAERAGKIRTRPLIVSVLVLCFY